MATYIFPDMIGNAMKKISVRTQMEAQLLSMTFILVGMMVIAVVTVFATNYGAFTKWMVGINAVAGLVLISSYIVGTFQQYSQYLIFLKAQEANKIQESQGSKGVKYAN